MTGRMKRLSDAEHEQIARAIAEAEKKTSGEIYCVLARSSDAYLYPACLIVALAIFILGPFLAFLLRHWWISIDPVHFAVAQLAAFGAAAGLVAVFERLRVALVPKALKYRRAHANAQNQFLAHNIHVTKGRTGVLIFVSLAERYVEIVADSEIDARVEQTVWNESVALMLEHARRGTLADGFAETIAFAGEVLSRHFPAGRRNSNEIADRLTEI
ncbi:TPM domain-containing protein [Nitratireductor kimnyeongensis]|uniref:TPM domain-containing protein n=1 Tax=Nitratireductor kimnyeongensis TaxID=430679 RepID=A0ABW0TDN8_9HYPH|nr:TPM domain-containing protein [Nitratireductor kimnyeongensis]QZZ36979.1 TPM domain-containing protein [Nitratireductor kimnyeongensis]